MKKDNEFSISELGLLKKLAEAGDCNAQYKLAKQLQKLEPLDKKDQALTLYKAAAKNGSAEAMHELGVIYDPLCVSSIKAPKNSLDSYRWHLEAAEHGDPRSMYLVGDILRSGRAGGPLKDLKASAHWFVKCYDTNPQNTDAMIALAGINLLGENYAHAIDWYRLAAELSDDYAIRELLRLNKEGLDDSTEEEIVQWLQDGENKGSVYCTASLAERYEYGQSVPKSLVHALARYLIAKIDEQAKGKRGSSTKGVSRLKSLLSKEDITEAERLAKFLIKSTLND